MRHYRSSIRCEACGEDQDFNYIRWADRTLCASCFPDAVKEYGEKFPFLLADEMNLDVLRVPEERAV